MSALIRGLRRMSARPQAAGRSHWDPGGFGTSRARLRLAVLTVGGSLSMLAAWGCTGGVGPGDDAGGPADATVVDGAVLLDARDTLDGVVPSADAGYDGPNDGGTAACVAQPCDPTSGSGCPELRTCVLTSRGPECVSIVAGRAEGEPCDGPRQCGAGLACFESRDGGVCRAVCCAGADATCAEGFSCREDATLVGGETSTWGWCLPPRTCDVLDQDAVCEAGEGCYIANAEGDTRCWPAGEGDVDDPCVEQNDCEPGLSCAGRGGATCKRICAVAEGTDPDLGCPPGEGQCIVYSQSPAGTGLCTVPPGSEP